MNLASSEDHFPDDKTLRVLLKDYVGKKAHVLDIRSADGRSLGNHGDTLMHLIFRCLLKDMGVIEVSDPRDADFLIVPPNGALLQQYVFPLYLAERLRPFKAIPLVIFPSSAYFTEVDPSFIFRDRTAETIWILREGYSYEMLRSRWNSGLAACGVRLALDHDVVVSGHRFVPSILGSVPQRDLTLIAPRIDFESMHRFVSAPLRQPASNGAGGLAGKLRRFASWTFDRVPESHFKTRSARILRSSASSRSRRDLMARLSDADREDVLARNRTIKTWDLSSKRYSTFDEYCRVLNEASLVVTDRLHVGLPAAILGKEVILMEGGYHKLGGVYEQSLGDAANVRLIRSA